MERVGQKVSILYTCYLYFDSFDSFDYMYISCYFKCHSHRLIVLSSFLTSILGCPNVFKWIASLGSVPVDDMFRTFNCGIGMVCIVAKEDVDVIVSSLRAAGEGAYVIGEVREEKDPSEERVTIVGVPF